jgi:hypothetical protein
MRAEIWEMDWGSSTALTPSPQTPLPSRTLMVKSGQGLAQRRKDAKGRAGDGVYHQSHPGRGASEAPLMRIKLTLISHWGAPRTSFLLCFCAGSAPKKTKQKHFSGVCNPQSPAFQSGKPLNLMRMGASEAPLTPLWTLLGNLYETLPTGCATSEPKTLFY